MIGLFDTYQQARSAVDALNERGLPRSSVRLASGDASTGDASGETADDHRGFFARLFGSMAEDDDRTGHYAEGVRRGATAVTVELEDDAMADMAADTLESCGAIDVDQRVEGWRAGGYTGYDAQAADYGEAERARDQQTLKVIQEELQVGKRQVETGGVRVHRRITEQPVQEQVTLREQHAVIERRPVDRPATAADLESLGQGEQDLVIRETAEQAVIGKTARVVEEVAVGARQSERTETVSDTVRRADVEIEKLNPQDDIPRGTVADPKGTPKLR